MTGRPQSGLEAASLLRLLQLCSPAFPSGSFAYSQGLEGAIERGWVRDVTSLGEWLAGVLSEGLGRTDLPLIAQACAAWDQTPSGPLLAPADTARVGAMAARVFALRETRELREEERQVGRAFARVLQRQGLPEASHFAGHAQASFIVLYALAVSRWRLPVTDALLGYCFAWTENQLAAASRLMPLGQLDAQALLAERMLAVPSLCAQALTIVGDDIGNTLPGFALASCLHEEQYSRLFRS